MNWYLNMRAIICLVLLTSALGACSSSDDVSASSNQASSSSAQLAITGEPVSSVAQNSSYGSGTDSATISWAAPAQNADGSNLKITGYVIRYGTSDQALTQVVKIGSGNLNSYSIAGLLKGKTYYFSIAAVSDMDIEGELSKPVSITI